MTSSIAPIADKLGKLLRLLTSDRDGEVLSAARAIVRTLEAAGTDIHVLAERVEKANGSSLSEAEMKKLYDAGYDAGMRAAANENTGFRSVDEPTWHEIAKACAVHASRLRDEREREFVQDMVRRTVRGGEPTEKQAKWLRAIYARVRR